MLFSLFEWILFIFHRTKCSKKRVEISFSSYWSIFYFCFFFVFCFFFFSVCCLQTLDFHSLLLCHSICSWYCSGNKTCLYRCHPASESCFSAKVWHEPFKKHEKVCTFDFRPVYGAVAFLLSQDRNLPSVLLTTPHFKTNTPKGAQVGAGTFAIYTTWMLGEDMATVNWN